MQLRWGAIERHVTHAPGVSEIRWRPRVPRTLRYRSPRLYARLLKHEVKRLTNWIGKPLDLVWCFDFNTFPDLRAFGATHTIFHPVDPLSVERQARIAASADLVLSVSPEILGTVVRYVPQVPASLVSHGIGNDFLALAKSEVTDFARSFQCGYFGNLDRPIINLQLLLQVIRHHQEITFNFWGPISPKGEMAKSLSQLPNVRFRGIVTKRALAEQVMGMDAFFLAYLEDEKESDLSNAHKILEYFAAGRVVISTYMSCFADQPDLLVRTPYGRSYELPELFTQVMMNLHQYNAPELVARRRALAAARGYPALIDQIGVLLAEAGSQMREIRAI